MPVLCDSTPVSISIYIKKATTEQQNIATKPIIHEQGWIQARHPAILTDSITGGKEVDLLFFFFAGLYIESCDAEECNKLEPLSIQSSNTQNNAIYKQILESQNSP